MVATRRSPLAAQLPERTVLQLERDHTSASMSNDWLPKGERSNLDSRGIQNTGNRCYQSSALQAFLHQPPFLQFITDHTSAGCKDKNCLMCKIRSLIADYWGTDRTQKPVGAYGAPNAIAMHCFSKSKDFRKGQQEDASLFYKWILEELERNLPPTKTWLPKFETLYRINLQHHHTCLTCGHVNLPPIEKELALDVGVDPVYTDVIDAIMDSFHTVIDDVDCSDCQAKSSVLRDSVILAAPKILTVVLKIRRLTHKIMHSMSCPEILDLTHLQKIPTLPLQYRLSGLVSHSGSYESGHYVATVRGQNPDTYPFISDGVVVKCTREEFAANPQRPQADVVHRRDGYQVCLLSYIRDDTVRAMPAAPRAGKGKNGRLMRELWNLV